MDLSATRQTISRGPKSCSARRKTALRVSGKSIMRPFMRRIVCGTAVAAGAGMTYPPESILNRPEDDTSSQQRAARPQNVCKRIGTIRAIFTRVLRSVFVDRAAEMLGVSRRTVYYRIREGKLRTIRTHCGTQRVLLDSIEELLREMRDERTATIPAAGAPNADPFESSADVMSSSPQH